MAGETAEPGGKRRTRRRPPAKPAASAAPAPAGDFYASALSRAERIELKEAAKVKGLDQEIALLRTKLRNVIKEKPNNLPLMLQGFEQRVKVVSARYRLPKRAEEELDQSVKRLLEEFGGQMMPEPLAGK